MYLHFTINLGTGFEIGTNLLEAIVALIRKFVVRTTSYARLNEG